MEQELIIFNWCMLAFGVIVSIICVILLRQVIKGDKIARPFLLSVLIYFALLAIANFQQVAHNTIYFDDIVASGELRIYTTFWVFLLTVTAPLYLTYEIEKVFLSDIKLGSKYHIFTILSLVLYTIYWYAMIIGVIIPNRFSEFKFQDFFFEIGGLLGVQVLFFILSFLYVGIKTTGSYRTYSLMVSLGWLLNYAVNTIVTTVQAIQPIVVIILLVPKLAGVIISAIGFYQLYALKSK